MSLVAKNLGLKVDGETWRHPFDLMLGPESFTSGVGPTGAGKPSLLVSLSKPLSGRLEMSGRNVTGLRLSPHLRSVGMLYQEYLIRCAAQREIHAYRPEASANVPLCSAAGQIRRRG